MRITKLLILSILFGGGTDLLFGQEKVEKVGKVGVKTQTPTEILDVNGTIRVRKLPVKGASKASSGNPSAQASEKYTPLNVLVSNDMGVIGTKSFAEVVAEPFKSKDTSDNSSAIMVIKRYEVSDWPSGQGGRKGFDTEMSVDKWQALLTGWMMESTNTQRNSSPAGVFGKLGRADEFGFQLFNDGTKWRLKGDIATIQEKQFIDILFIKRKFVSFKNVN
ncbi:MAG: hypothetical protein Q4A00_02705 [Flavobacteriaceae bacterium]|nr:hypothetical protein [Flavobacteriaceae bacterium]